MVLEIRTLLLADDTKDLFCGVVPDDVADGSLDNGNTASH